MPDLASLLPASSFLKSLDIWIVLFYAVSIFVLAQVVSRRKAGEAVTSNGYFLAGNTLPWWAIGASLIAANISAEQIIGMSGSGYKIGLAIASYEWMAAITLIIVGKYFLPVFLRNGVHDHAGLPAAALRPVGEVPDGDLLADPLRLRQSDLDPVAGRHGGDDRDRPRYPDRADRRSAPSPCCISFPAA